VRRMLSEQVHDVVASTGSAIQDARPSSVDDVRAMGPLVRFSMRMQAESRVLKRFLFENLYRHTQVEAKAQRAKDVIGELFDCYRADPSQMPAAYSSRPDTARAVTDYIAGMTDRFALKEHHRLTGRTAF
jgi:dGTPase